jgi:plasmid stabilization system protein ParE
MSQYLLARAAESDLDSIWDYIAQDSMDAADRWIAKLFEAFEDLAANPAIGHKREDLTALPVLFWPVGSYLILYRRQLLDRIEIVAVTEGARDIPSFLEQRDLEGKDS